MKKENTPVKTVSKTTPKKAETKKPVTPKKPAAKKPVAAQKPAAKKPTAAKKPAAKKPVAAKEPSMAKKPVTAQKTTAAKKPAVQKTTVKPAKEAPAAASKRKSMPKSVHNTVPVKKEVVIAEKPAEKPAAKGLLQKASAVKRTPVRLPNHEDLSLSVQSDINVENQQNLSGQTAVEHRRPLISIPKTSKDIF